MSICFGEVKRKTLHKKKVLSPIDRERRPGKEKWEGDSHSRRKERWLSGKKNTANYAEDAKEARRRECKRILWSKKRNFGGTSTEEGDTKETGRKNEGVDMEEKKTRKQADGTAARGSQQQKRGWGTFSTTEEGGKEVDCWGQGGGQ